MKQRDAAFAMLTLACWTMCLTSVAAAPLALRAVPVDPSGFPSDMVEPEGRTRWDLSAVRLSDEVGGALDCELAASDGDVERWVHPERFANSPLGTRVSLRLSCGTDAAGDRLLIELELVGVGWLHLPSGPREVVLERALVLRQAAAAAAYEPDRIIHRWVEPAQGVVAEVWGAPDPGGRERVSILGAAVSASALAPSSLAKLYLDEVISPVLSDINYGWDRGRNVPVSSLTTPSYATIGDLINASTWDFASVPETTALAGTTTANNATSITGTGTQFQTELKVGDKIALSSAPATFARVTAITSQTAITVSAGLGNGSVQSIVRKRGEIASTSVPINAAETCNATLCGYNVPGAWLDREDKYFDDPASLNRTNAVSQREDRGSDVTIWLRAGSQNEGVSGSFGTGESKFCYTPPKTPVPLWVFPHQDAGGYYFQPGDSWTSAVFNCEQNIYNQVCTGGCGFLCALYSGPGSGHTGTQGSAVLSSGVLTLPSGHTFNTILVRTVADFCVYLTSSCGSCLSPVRTVVYLWQAPYQGTVVRLTSVQNAPDFTSFTAVDETNIKFGLLPPRTIQVTRTTDTSVSLSWDPGLDTHRITDYKVYWDTDSGAATPYASSMVTGGTSAAIGGLTPGTTYYFTVTARSTFTDPSSGVVTTYESLLYPRQTTGDPSFVYPVEVQATTACAEVTGLRVNKAAGGNIQICWNPSSAACAIGYRVFGAGSPTSAAGFSTLADTGLETTCWTGNPGQGYFLAITLGVPVNGYWGHYGL